MTLAQQFPDISAAIRLKNENGSKAIRSTNAIQRLNYAEPNAVTQYYEGEFRRWHFKFLFIVAASLGIVYFIMLKSFWIYNVVNLR